MRSVSQRLWSPAIKWGWVILLFTFAWPSLRLETLPRLEGRLLPVVTQMYDIEVTELSSGYVEVVGLVDKLRDCVIDRVEWRRGRIDGRSVPVRPVSRGRTIDHPPGTFEVGPWILPMTRDEFLRNAFSYAVHDCHALLPWLTQTRLLSPIGVGEAD